MAVFPEAKLFSVQNFRVKNEIQNWNPEFARRYGMAAGDHCGDLVDMMLATGTATRTGTGRRLAPPAPARRHRPATGHGHRLPARVAGPAARPRVAATASHGTGHRQRTARPHGPAPARQSTGQRGDVAKHRTGCGRF